MRVYGELIKSFSNEIGFRIAFIKCGKVKGIKVKKIKDIEKINKIYYLGKLYALLSSINLTNVFFKNINIDKDKNLMFNFNNVEQYIEREEYGNHDLSSIEVCFKMLKVLSYNEEDLYNDKYCSETVLFLKDSWKDYSSIFMLAYKNTYNYIKDNKREFSFLAEDILENEDHIHYLSKNINSLNSGDLSLKLNIIKIQFDRMLSLSFKITNLIEKDKLNYSNAITILEEIADKIINKSIIGFNNNELNRSFIGYKKLDNDKITYDHLGFDFAQGILGIAYFIIKLYTVTKNKYYLNIAEEILATDNIDAYIGIYKNRIELAMIYNMLFKITDKEIYNKKFEKVKITTLEVNKYQNRFRSMYKKTNTNVISNNSGELFLGVEYGLAGVGLYVLDSYVNKNNYFDVQNI